MTWYKNACFYHMYPLGMTGAPMQNTAAAVIVTAINCDDQPAVLDIPAPLPALQAEDLTSTSLDTLPVMDGRIRLTLSGNTGIVLKIREV